MGLFCHLQEISLLYLSYLLDKCRGLGLLKARMLVFYKTSQIPNQIKIYFFIFFFCIKVGRNHGSAEVMNIGLCWILFGQI